MYIFFFVEKIFSETRTLANYTHLCKRVFRTSPKEISLNNCLTSLNSQCTGRKYSVCRDKNL